MGGLKVERWVKGREWVKGIGRVKGREWVKGKGRVKWVERVG